MEKQQDPATERLYAPSSDDGSDYEGQRPTSQRWTSNGLSMRSKVAIGASYVILIVLCVFLGIENLRLQQQVRESQSLVFPSKSTANRPRIRRPNQGHSPTVVGIAKDKAWFRHDRVFSTTVNDTVFAGEPSPELDRAWHDMLQSKQIAIISRDCSAVELKKKRTIQRMRLTKWYADTTIRVSKEDLDFYNVTSLPLADGSGYASETFMTHELHCLVRCPSYLSSPNLAVANEAHRNVFANGSTETITTRTSKALLAMRWAVTSVRTPLILSTWTHMLTSCFTDHCIETLRQGIMCRGDLSLGTYTYLGKSRTDIMGVTARTWGKHRCIDFDAIMKWSSDRVIDILEPGLLEDPKTVDWKHFTVPGPPH